MTTIIQNRIVKSELKAFDGRPREVRVCAGATGASLCSIYAISASAA
jgi:hypothetical protein